MDMSITPSQRERKAGKLFKRNLSKALEAIRTDGYVVIENIVDTEHLNILRVRMDEDSAVLTKAEKWGGAGHLIGHLQQGPPLCAPFVFQDVVANPIVIQVNTELLGEGIFNKFYNGNTNCPGSISQPMHRDGPALWPGQVTPHPTAQVVVNIPPQEVTEENGAIELWPGSHLNTISKYPINEGMQEEQRKINPPIRGCTNLGSVLIRDIRLWHRGVPNLSDNPRHMIAQIHTIHWYRRGESLLFQTGCEDAFPENCGLDHNATFTEKSLDHLGLSPFRD